MIALQVLWCVALVALAISVVRNANRTWRMYFPAQPAMTSAVSEKPQAPFFQWWFRRYWTFMRLLWASIYFCAAALVWIGWKPAIICLLFVPASMILSIPMTWLIMGSLWKYHFNSQGKPRRPRE